MRFPISMVVLAAGLALAGCNQGQEGPKGDKGDPGPAGPAGQAGGAIVRTVTSTSCSSDGCPSTCAADESLVSAICTGNGTAKFSDNLRFDGGALTAQCSASSESIVLTCVRK
jgi:hypothetical protein